jgi:hypothetical protein
VFICGAFIAGEILQTIAHECEFLIDLFFKCRRPSKVFLYESNPIIGEYHRKELKETLNLDKNQRNIFEKRYDELATLKKTKEDEKLSQSIFWKLYHIVNETQTIKTTNRTYLFTRVLIVEFLIISILCFMTSHINI